MYLDLLVVDVVVHAMDCYAAFRPATYPRPHNLLCIPGMPVTPSPSCSVMQAPNDPAAINYSAFVTGAQKGVLGEGVLAPTTNEKPAASRYAFIGLQPDSIVLYPRPSPSLLNCSIAGLWIQEVSGQLFGPVVTSADRRHFAWDSNPYKKDGWSKFNGTYDNHNKLTLTYFRDDGHQAVEHGRYVDCQQHQ